MMEQWLLLHACQADFVFGFVRVGNHSIINQPMSVTQRDTPASTTTSIHVLTFQQHHPCPACLDHALIIYKKTALAVSCIYHVELFSSVDKAYSLFRSNLPTLISALQFKFNQSNKF